ncbi:hypothetical protein AYK20_06830 [Thermoplasmatales archaeon SG8-52-1]|nr:MAG: hypothetical protein AYK20_06830 [Thermoplasmatales archaeon SG8-52-1]
MRIISFIVCFLLVSIVFSVEGYEEKETFEHRSITREKILEIAEAYADHEWYPTVENIFHGFCNDCNKQVDTPDSNYYGSGGWIVGEKNIGVPYQWGGFSSLSGLGLFPQEDFDEQYTGTGGYSGTIHYGGDIACVGSYGCIRACGVDCSGFVSRCWNLPGKESTKSLPDISIKIKYDSLKPGDILDIPGEHVILFKEFVNEEKTLIRTIEANWPKVYENIYNAEVSVDGYSITLDGGKTYEIYTYEHISNFPPSLPIIDGPTHGKTWILYTYTLNSTDPDGDDIAKYIINFGDGTSEVTLNGPYASGDEVIAVHLWTKVGFYTIKAKAVDLYGHETDWSELTVTMPRDKTASSSPFLIFLERYPLLQTLLMRLGLQ